MDSDRPLFRLESDWAPADGTSGILTLTLGNSGDVALRDFQLAFTSLFPLAGADNLHNARLVRRILSYQVIAPADGAALAPGASWSASIRLAGPLRHYTSAVKSAYLIRDDGGIVDVEVRPMTRNGEPGAPRLEAWRPPACADGAAPAAILPYPRSVRLAGRRDAAGALRLADGPPDARLACDAASALGRRLFPAEPPLFAPDGAIVCTMRHADLAGEAYRIDFAADGVALLASGQAGFFYGLVTLGQMLRAARIAPDRYTFPAAGEIADAPRFAWRGMLLDVARQVFSADDIARALDCLAWHKLNRLHLHLTDNEGWRLDIPAWPQLAARGGWRGDGLDLPPLLGSPPARYGLVYSPADLARLAARAAQLGVAIVPEIEMPAHAFAMLQALPELRDPFDTGLRRDILNPAVPLTDEVVAAVLDEVVRRFPSPWIHIGADEVPADAWLHSPLALALMRDKGRQDIYQIQAHFLRRVQAMLRARGRRTGAWEEAGRGGSIEPRDSYLVAWTASGIALAEQGYDIVLAPGDACYLDMAQSDDWWEPGMDWAGTVTPRRCYDYDPGADWPDHLRTRLIGIQACLWSEHLHDRRLIDRLTVPRLSAIAETAWTPSRAKDFRRFAAMAGLMPGLGIR